MVPAQSLLITHSASSLSNDTISFTLQIQPILVNHCSPCHFTGGKMYEKLPLIKEKLKKNLTHIAAQNLSNVK